jgi:hypothetical protein
LRWDSAVGIVTRLRGGRGLIIFRSAQTALGPTDPTVGTGDIFTPKVKKPVGEADYSTPLPRHSSGEVKLPALTNCIHVGEQGKFKLRQYNKLLHLAIRTCILLVYIPATCTCFDFQQTIRLYTKN